MDTNIYREIDENEVVNPDKLDEVMVVIKPSGWIKAAILMIVMSFILNWAMNGTMSVTLEANGILLSDFSLKKVKAPVDGKIRVVNVTKGELFEKNSPLIEIIGEKSSTILNSDFKGKVLDTYVGKEDMVFPNQELLLIEKNIKPTEIEGVLFIPFEERDKINPGMGVKISTERKGNENSKILDGVVKSISTYPVTYEDMIRKFPVSELIKVFFKENPLAEVRVELKSETLLNGVFCRGTIHIKDKHPMDLLWEK